MMNLRVRARRDPASVALLLLSTSFVLASCSKDQAPASAGPVPIEVQTAREIAAAFFGDGDRMADARAALEPLLRRNPVYAEDLLSAAAVELELNHVEPAGAFLDRAEQQGEASARFHYLKALFAYRSGAAREAEKEFERTAALAPNDLPTQLMIATCRMERGDATAEEPLRRVQAAGVELAASWYLTAIYRLNQVCLRWNKAEEAERLRREFSEVQAKGIVVASVREMERGNFGRLDFPRPAPAVRAAPRPLPKWQAPVVLAKEFADATELFALDLVDEGKIEHDDLEPISWSIGGCDLVGAGPSGIVAASPSADGSWKVRRLWTEPVTRCRAFDFGQDGDLDFLVVTANGIELLVGKDGTWTRANVTMPALPSPVTDLQAVDFDHEGDLDLMLVGAFGVRLWRDDGADRGGAFVDVTDAAGLGGADPCEWCLAEDLDCDQDVDLLVGGRRGVVLADNLRGGRFAKRNVALPEGIAPDVKPVVADLDGDSRPDLCFGAAGGVLLRGTKEGPWAVEKRPPIVPPLRSEGCLLADLNCDGEFDLLRWDTPALGAVLSAGAVTQVAVPQLAADAAAPARAAVQFATGSGHSPAVAFLSERGLELLAPADERSAPIRLALLGRKDNRRGVGAVVEVRAGATYQRVYWTGEPRLIGLGDAQQADWIRVTWPNGVVQSELAIPGGSDRILEQKEGLIGSCPFLYAWNGKTYGFVTDVLGVTPLGLPMAPDELVPPDHDESVLVRGDQLVPRDGRYELQFTEELREVTYLDRARLDVVDHPAGTEIYPDERFTFPPFPPTRLLTMTTPLAPTRVRGSDGRDWTEALRACDLRFAAPFTPYRGADAGGPASTGQFLGLAPPHFLELEFDPHAIPASGPLRLVLTGWFYWTDASVNLASSRTPDVHFVPPMLEVPDGHGGWRETGPPIGFPAGKVKTMVIDVGDLLVRADPRLRISSTLRLYWDSIRLATDAAEVPLRVTQLEASRADLHARGFSAALELPGAQGLAWFDWDRLAAQPRWNQHPGLYTRYGDVRELVGAIDDRFVVLGSGDALTLHFPAADVPALPAGWQRDYVVFLDGWAKDRDPNTVDALYVEPLPFHGMSGYPYGADEHPPRDELHRQWLLDWQTRPARTWIPPLTVDGSARRPGG